MRKGLATALFLLLSAASFVCSKNAIVCHQYEESEMGEDPQCTQRTIISDGLKCECDEIKRNSEKILILERQQEEQQKIIFDLSNALSSLLQQQEQSRNISSNITTSKQNDYKLLDDGWVDLLNGYQYKLTASIGSYDTVKRECGDMEATLAVYGIKDSEKRKILQGAFNLFGYMWIGLNDKENEGTWLWENGEVATAADLWFPGEPRRDGWFNNYDCALMFWWNMLASAKSCKSVMQGLCEKPLIK